MSSIVTKTAQRVAVAALFAVTLAACSTPNEQTASQSSVGKIRTWADWSTTTSSAPTASQTAALPASGEIRSWADWTPVSNGQQ
ncbi:MAG: hypothetical protein WDN69_09855 [Aliidongia sp.]